MKRRMLNSPLELNAYDDPFWLVRELGQLGRLGRLGQLGRLGIPLPSPRCPLLRLSQHCSVQRRTACGGNGDDDDDGGDGDGKPDVQRSTEWSLGNLWRWREAQVALKGERRTHCKEMMCWQTLPSTYLAMCRLAPLSRRILDSELWYKIFMVQIC